MAFDEVPDEQNPAELLKRIEKLEREMIGLRERSIDLEAGIVRMATYQGVMHVLKGS